MNSVKLSMSGSGREAELRQDFSGRKGSTEAQDIRCIQGRLDPQWLAHGIGGGKGSWIWKCKLRLDYRKGGIT